MKIIVPQVDYVFDCAGEKMCSIIIENQKLLYSVVCDILGQIQGDDGKTVLSEDNQVLSISKCAELITQFTPFELNHKNLISKVVSQMQKIVVDEQHYLKTQQLVGDWERYLMELSVGMVGNLNFPKVLADTLVKSAGIEFDDTYDSLAEKIIDCFELVQEYDKRKLFILVNLRSYLSDEEMNIFMQDVLTRNIQVLLLESSERTVLQNEKRYIVDADLCVIC